MEQVGRIEGARVSLELDVLGDDLADVLVELYRRLGEEDGWALQSVWVAGGLVPPDVVSAAWEVAKIRIRRLGLRGSCGIPGCRHRLLFDGRPACRLSGAELREMVRERLRVTWSVLRATFSGRRRNR